MTITEAFAVYDQRVLYKRKPKTKKNYITAVNSMLKAWGNIPIELIGEEQLYVWVCFMRDEGCTGTTQRGYIMCLRGMFKHFRASGMQLFDIRTWEMPACDTPPRTALEPHEVEKLIEAAKNARDKAIIACLFLTGTRISEILNLDRNDLSTPADEDGFKEVFVEGKGGKWRPIFFSHMALKYLDAYLETRSDRFRPLFVSGQNKRITVSRVEQIVHKCARDAQLEKHVTPHILRHSFTSDLLNNGAPLYEVSKLLGHANVATTANIYGHFDTKMRKSALAKKQSPLSFEY